DPPNTSMRRDDPCRTANSPRNVQDCTSRCKKIRCERRSEIEKRLTSKARMAEAQPRSRSSSDRRYFIGGSDARIIMGDDEGALIRLWREKRGEVEPEDLSGNLVVQLGVATEELNRRWYEASTGHVVTDVQKRVRHPALPWMGATLDGRIRGS